MYFTRPTTQIRSSNKPRLYGYGLCSSAAKLTPCTACGLHWATGLTLLDQHPHAVTDRGLIWQWYILGEVIISRMVQIWKFNTFCIFFFYFPIRTTRGLTVDRRLITIIAGRVVLNINIVITTHTHRSPILIYARGTSRPLSGRFDTVQPAQNLWENQQGTSFSAVNGPTNDALWGALVSNQGRSQSNPPRVRRVRTCCPIHRKYVV